MRCAFIGQGARDVAIALHEGRVCIRPTRLDTTSIRVDHTLSSRLHLFAATVTCLRRVFLWVHGSSCLDIHQFVPGAARRHDALFFVWRKRLLFIQLVPRADTKAT